MSIILSVVGRDKISDEEWELLTLWQAEVLACIRHFGSCRRASEELGRSETSIRMVIARMRNNGVDVQ